MTYRVELSPSAHERLCLQLQWSLEAGLLHDPEAGDELRAVLECLLEARPVWEGGA